MAAAANMHLANEDAMEGLRWAADVMARMGPDDRLQFLAAIVARAEMNGAEALRPPLNRQERLDRRDELIREALGVLYPGAKPSVAARDLQDDLRRYLAVGWLNEQHLDALPEGASRHRRYMHEIASLNDGRELRARQILNVRDGFRTP